MLRSCGLWNLRRGLRAGGVALVGLLCAAPALALPVSLTVDAVQSSVLIEIVVPNAPIVGTLSGSDTIGVAGTAEADVSFGATPMLEVTSGDLTLGDFDISLLSGFFGNVDVTSSNLGSGIAGGPAAGTETQPGSFDFDLVGFILSIDSGVIDLTASGLAGSQIDDTTVDLGAEPIDFVLPAATIATVDATPLPGGEFDLVVTIPFEIETSLDQVEQENQVLLSGTIVLTGQAIPEPSTLLLLSLGLGGLAYGSRLRS
ncbi:MAG: PEP-CTERM sorting domain-containing protein [Proteobacteria bacterium]|nr:PEP-CTERM sorting domain-containing protein [Pseudomonadota bacterium]